MHPTDALARIRRYDGRLKAFVQVFDPPLYGEDEDGPTVAIKDLFDVAGVPTGGGARASRSEPRPPRPRRRAPAAGRLLGGRQDAHGRTGLRRLGYKSRGRRAVEPLGRHDPPRPRRLVVGIRGGRGRRPLRRGARQRYGRLGAHPGGDLRRRRPQARPRPRQPEGRPPVGAGPRYGGDSGPRCGEPRRAPLRSSRDPTATPPSATPLTQSMP